MTETSLADFQEPAGVGRRISIPGSEAMLDDQFGQQRGSVDRRPKIVLSVLLRASRICVIVITVVVSADLAWAEHMPTAGERQLLYIMAVVFVLCLASLLVLLKITAGRGRRGKARSRRR